MKFFFTGFPLVHTNNEKKTQIKSKELNIQISSHNTKLTNSESKPLERKRLRKKLVAFLKVVNDTHLHWFDGKLCERV